MRVLALLLILHGWALAQTGGDAFKTPFSLSCSGAAILPRRARINLTGAGVSSCVDNAAANRTDVTITGGGLGGGMTSFSLAGDSGTPQTIADSDTLTIAGGAGIATTASATDTVSIATASQEAGFIADGATTDLTCGSSAQGKAETRDDGILEWCDGATTSVLRRAAFGDGSGVATSATALAANGTNCSSGTYPLGVDASGNAESCGSAINGNAGTATALAANPVDCSASQYATTIGANGDLTCATIPFSDISGAVTDVQVPNTITINLAATATALAANPANCGSGLAAGVDASGVAEGCSTNIATATALAANPANCGSGLAAGVDASGVAEGCSTNIATATALAANGSNCSAGSFPLGVDASGASESCTTLASSNAGTATALAANGANCSAGTYPLGVDASGAAESCGSNINGNAATATALAANGANCSAGSFPLGVDASGASEGCTALSASNTGTATALAANGTNCSAGSYPLGVDASGNAESCGTAITGNAGTATALAANGGNCSAGSFPLGVDASGASESCTALSASNAGTATALAANGTNCSAGSFPLGVDASGNSESCTVATTGTVTNIATTSPVAGGPITSTGTISITNDGITATQLAAAVELPAACTTSGQLVKSNGAGPTWGCQSQGTGNSLDADTVDGLHAASFDLASSSANMGGRAFLQANAGGL